MFERASLPLRRSGAFLLTFPYLDNRRRSASPQGSGSPNKAYLPHRGKGGPDRPSTLAASLSFKVGSQDGDRERGRAGDREGSYHEDRGRERRGEEQRRGEGEEDGAVPMDQDEEDLEVEEGEDDGADAMAAMMGFGGFGTTKGKQIAGNNMGAVRKEKKTEYRQYMNRTGGFNRPLSPPR